MPFSMPYTNDMCTFVDVYHNINTSVYISYVFICHMWEFCSSTQIWEFGF